jgi:hypothetical protein
MNTNSKIVRKKSFAHELRDGMIDLSSFVTEEQSEDVVFVSSQSDENYRQMLYLVRNRMLKNPGHIVVALFPNAWEAKRFCYTLWNSLPDTEQTIYIRHFGSVWKVDFRNGSEFKATFDNSQINDTLKILCKRGLDTFAICDFEFIEYSLKNKLLSSKILWSKDKASKGKWGKLKHFFAKKKKPSLILTGTHERSMLKLYTTSIFYDKSRRWLCHRA